MGRKRGSQEPGMVNIVFIFKYDQLILFLVLIENFNQEPNCQLRLAWTTPNKELNRAKRGENVVFKGHGWYYTISIYKNCQLTFFLVVLKKFNQKSKFYPQLA